MILQEVQGDMLPCTALGGGGGGGECSQCGYIFRRRWRHRGVHPSPAAEARSAAGAQEVHGSVPSWKFLLSVRTGSPPHVCRVCRVRTSGPAPGLRPRWSKTGESSCRCRSQTLCPTSRTKRWSLRNLLSITFYIFWYIINIYICK